MSIEKPSVLFVVFNKDGSVKEICKTEYQARTKAGDEFEWWPCILKKINQ
jgi:hypothetical protein